MGRPITAEFSHSEFHSQDALRGINAAIALEALAALGAPVLRGFVRIGAILEAQAAARKQRREDERLWNVALSDARVMADLSRAMSADAVRDTRGYY